MAIELRVHGVSGSPATGVLDRPWLGRVAGDNDSGFYRPLPFWSDPSAGPRRPLPFWSDSSAGPRRPRPEIGGATGPGGATLEGYSWGSLTSGAAARALWLLLLPFMFANVALWLRPPAMKRTARWRPGAYRTIARLFAASLTGTFVLALAGVSLDL